MSLDLSEKIKTFLLDFVETQRARRRRQREGPDVEEEENLVPAPASTSSSVFATGGRGGRGSVYEMEWQDENVARRRNVGGVELGRSSSRAAVAEGIPRLREDDEIFALGATGDHVCNFPIVAHPSSSAGRTTYDHGFFVQSRNPSSASTTPYRAIHLHTSHHLSKSPSSISSPSFSGLIQSAQTDLLEVSGLSSATSGHCTSSSRRPAPALRSPSISSTTSSSAAAHLPSSVHTAEEYDAWRRRSSSSALSVYPPLDVPSQASFFTLSSSSVSSTSDPSPSQAPQAFSRSGLSRGELEYDVASVASGFSTPTLMSSVGAGGSVMGEGSDENWDVLSGSVDGSRRT
jgi:hypothetical protein